MFARRVTARGTPQAAALVALVALVALAGCGATETVTVAPTAEPPPIETHAAEATAPSGAAPLEVRVIDLPGDGRVVPVGIGREGSTLVYLAASPDGLLRIDVASDGAVSTATLSMDVRPVRATYEAGELWWMSGRTRQLMPSASDRRTGGPPVLSVSHPFGIGERVRGELALCPEPDGLGATPSCDHPLRAVLGVASSLVVGGGLTPALGQQPVRGFVARIDRTGAIAASRTLEHEGIVQTLAASDDRLLAIGVSREREGGRPWTVGLDPGDLSEGETVHARPASVSRPWAVAAAHDGGFWVVASYTRYELTFLHLAADGALRAEHALTLPAPELAFQSTQALVTVGGALSLLVAESGGGDARLRMFRIDPVRGEVTDERRAPLPAGTWVHHVHAWPGGIALAARVGVERPVLLIVDG